MAIGVRIVLVSGRLVASIALAPGRRGGFEFGLGLGGSMVGMWRGEWRGSTRFVHC